MRRARHPIRRRAVPCAAPTSTPSAGRSRSRPVRDCRFGCPPACGAPSVGAARRGSGVRCSQRLVFELRGRPPARAGSPSLRLRPDGRVRRAPHGRRDRRLAQDEPADDPQLGLIRNSGLDPLPGLPGYAELVPPERAGSGNLAPAGSDNPSASAQAMTSSEGLWHVLELDLSMREAGAARDCRFCGNPLVEL